MTSLREIVEVFADGFEKLMPGRRTIESFVAKWGVECQAAPLPAEIRKGRSRACFINAFRLSIYKKLTYVEGYAIRAELPLPVLHAWCVRPGESTAIDTTTSCFVEYFGVPIDRAYLRRRYREARWSMSILDDYERGWPLMQMTDDEVRAVIAKVNQGDRNAPAR